MRRRPWLAAAAAGAAGVVASALTGCALFPAPTPKPLSVAQKCTPWVATIQWKPIGGFYNDIDGDAINTDPAVQTANFVPVRATVLDYSQGGGNFESHFISLGSPVNVHYTSEFAKPWSAVPGPVWGEMLIESVRLTGQVPTDFGTSPGLPDTAISVEATKGKFLQLDEEAQATVPFSIKCAGEKAVTGTISGVADAGVLSVIVSCTQKPSSHDDAEEDEAISLASEYCDPTS